MVKHNLFSGTIALAICCLLLLAHSMNIYAAKAAHLSREVTLVDGRVVTVRLQGDENIHYLYSNEGEVIMQDEHGFRVATQSEVDSLNEVIETYSRSVAQAQAKAMAGLRANTGEDIDGYRLFPHTGRQKVLVLMANFSDQRFTYSKEAIDSMLNTTKKLTKAVKNNKCYSSGKETLIRRLHPYHSYSSVREYFKTSSDGAFEPEFDVYGPYNLSRASTYYGYGADGRIGEFVKDVCSLANDDVDFSEYDQDGDGYVDIVYIVYAGYSANASGEDNLIWAKCGGFASSEKYDGKSIYRYGVSNELLGYDGFKDNSTGLPFLNGIGVFCHEFSHALGLPDIYPTQSWSIKENGVWVRDNEKYDNQSAEAWDVMDDGLNTSGGCWPPLYTAYERELMGWGTMDTLSAPADVTMKPIMHGGRAYKVMNDNDETGNEYWLLEVLSCDSISENWHQYMPGRGLLITHVNYSKSVFQSFTTDNSGNHVNDIQGLPRYNVLPADGFLPTSYRQQLSESHPLYMSLQDMLKELSGDTYPGSKGITEFNNYKAYTGVVDKPLTEITQHDDFSVSFKFMGGAPVLLGDVNEDGRITMSDANDVVSYFLAADKESFENFNVELADMNEDGDISMSDANEIVGIFLSSEENVDDEQQTGGGDETEQQTGGGDETEQQTGGGDETEQQTGGGDETEQQTGGGDNTEQQTGGGDNTEQQTGGSDNTEQQTGGGDETEQQTGGSDNTEQQTGGGDNIEQQTGGGDETEQQTGGGDETEQQTGGGDETEQQTGGGDETEQQTGGSDNTEQQTGGGDETEQQTGGSDNTEQQTGGSDNTEQQTGGSDNTEQQTSGSDNNNNEEQSNNPD